MKNKLLITSIFTFIIGCGNYVDIDQKVHKNYSFTDSTITYNLVTIVWIRDWTKSPIDIVERLSSYNLKCSEVDSVKSIHTIRANNIKSKVQKLHNLK